MKSKDENSSKEIKKDISKKIPLKKKLRNSKKNKVEAVNLVQIEKEKFIRLFAEFENYKKRTSRERIELFKTANQDLMASILPIIDDFDRALKEVDKKKNIIHFEGFKLIYNKFNEILKQKGLMEIEISDGTPFNSEIHEAITQIPAEDKDKGKILDVIEKGYKLGEKIIRYPKVIVGQ